MSQCRNNNKLALQPFVSCDRLLQKAYIKMVALQENVHSSAQNTLSLQAVKNAKPDYTW